MSEVKNEEVVDVVEGEVVEKESKLSKAKGLVKKYWKPVAAATGLTVIGYLTGRAVGKIDNSALPDNYDYDSDETESDDDTEM